MYTIIYLKSFKYVWKLHTKKFKKRLLLKLIFYSYKIFVPEMDLLANELNVNLSLMKCFSQSNRIVLDILFIIFLCEYFIIFK